MKILKINKNDYVGEIDCGVYRMVECYVGDVLEALTYDLDESDITSLLNFIVSGDYEETQDIGEWFSFYLDGFHPKEAEYWVKKMSEPDMRKKYPMNINNFRNMLTNFNDNIIDVLLSKHDYEAEEEYYNNLWREEEKAANWEYEHSV